MNLKSFAGSSVSFKIEIVSGREIELTFRPYTLADMAWAQQNFTEEQRQNIAAMMVDESCRLFWHQLDRESKDKFDDFRFEDEDGNDVEPDGYLKLLHSMASQQDLIKAWSAYGELQSLNGFLDTGEKKKTTKKKTSKRSMTKSLRNTVFRRKNS